MWRAHVWPWVFQGGLFGVCGRAAELGNVASSSVSETLSASDLMLWNICGSWEFTQNLQQKKSSSSYCTELGNLSHRGCRQTLSYQQRFMIDKVHKECLHLKVGLIRKCQELCRKPYPCVLVSQEHAQFHRHHRITKHFSVSIFNFIKHIHVALRNCKDFNTSWATKGFIKIWISDKCSSCLFCKDNPIIFSG